MRSDISDFLIHFTKDSESKSAYENLKSIINNRFVRGTNTKIKDGSNCVCFSEAPLSSLEAGLLNPSFYSPYSPFGIFTTKLHIHALGGRHVIYQPTSELSQLSPSNSWRHMRYEPPSIDFTWEREWRLKTDAYRLDPSNTKIIVPSARWTETLIKEHDEQQQWQTLQYSQIMDESLASQYEDRFPWTIIELE